MPVLVDGYLYRPPSRQSEVFVTRLPYRPGHDYLSSTAVMSGLTVSSADIKARTM